MPDALFAVWQYTENSTAERDLTIEISIGLQSVSCTSYWSVSTIPKAVLLHRPFFLLQSSVTFIPNQLKAGNLMDI